MSSFKRGFGRIDQYYTKKLWDMENDICLFLRKWTVNLIDIDIYIYAGFGDIDTAELWYTYNTSDKKK